MTKQELIDRIRKLKNSDVAQVIDNRIREFKEQGKKKEEEVFSELCFCLMTANFNAEKCIHIQKELGRTKGFEILPEDKLANELKKLGHRFPNTRANYISEARGCSVELHNAIMKKDGNKMRGWLVENVKGLGMKEASHFLRNIGYKDVAIIDFHIIDLLERNSLIEKPKNMTKDKYIEIENILRNLAREVELDLASLDLYMWYIETGKVLK
tara:strand:- start:751 stop:1386 length:636 start_codon:yes stop_codon:yes gene_type:complete